MALFQGCKAERCLKKAEKSLKRLRATVRGKSRNAASVRVE